MDGRVLTTNAKSHNDTLQIINAYTPNNPSDHKKNFNNLWRHLNCNDNHILMGNFKCVPDIRLDKKGGDDSLGIGEFSS